MHLLLHYEFVEGMLERRAPHREAHLALIAASHRTGEIVMAGAVGDPPTGGLIVFRGVDREHVEAFAEADPYVTAGLVTSRRVEPWRVVAGG